MSRLDKQGPSRCLQVRSGCCKFISSYFGCLEGGSKSVQVLFNGIEAVIVLTLRILN